MLLILPRGLGNQHCSAWKDDQVRVMAVCPWVVNTDLVAGAMDCLTQQEKDEKRIMSPTDVAVAVEQLLLSGKPGDVVNITYGELIHYQTYDI